jgi:hypothetical protein
MQVLHSCSGSGFQSRFSNLAEPADTILRAFATFVSIHSEQPETKKAQGQGLEFERPEYNNLQSCLVFHNSPRQPRVITIAS